MVCLWTDRRRGMTGRCWRLLLAFIAIAGLRSVGADELPLSLEYESSPQILISLVRQPRCAALTADGGRLATADVGGSIVVWDVQSGRPVRKLAATSAVNSMCFHPTEPQLAAASGDHTIQIWNVETGESLKVLPGHTRRITALGFSPDGKQLLSGSYDKTSRLWDLAAPENVALVREHTSAVTAAAFASDGSGCATGTLSGELKLWSMSGEPVASPESQRSKGVRALLFHPTRREWLIGGGNGEIWISGSKSGGEPVRLQGPASASAITRMTLGANGRLLAAGDQNGGIRLHNLDAPDSSALLESHQDDICGLAFLETSQSLISVSLDASVRQWKPMLPAEPRMASLDQEIPDKLWAVALSPDDAAIYAAGRKGFLASWDLSTGRRLRAFDGFKGTIDALSLSADGSRLACCGWKQNSVVLFQTQTGEKELERHTEANVRCVRFHPDGQQLAAGLADGRIVIWSGSGGDARTVTVSSQPVYDIAFSPDGSLAAVSTGDWKQSIPGSVMIWETQGWTEQRRFNDHSRAVRTVVFSPDGARIASTGEDGLVVVRELQSPLPVAKLQNAVGARSLVFHPDGRQLAVGLHNRVIAVWDLERGELVRRFRAEDDVFGLAYTSDGSVLISVSGEPRIELWPGLEQASAASRIQNWRVHE